MKVLLYSLIVLSFCEVYAATKTVKDIYNTCHYSQLLGFLKDNNIKSVVDQTTCYEAVKKNPDLDANSRFAFSYCKDLNMRTSKITVPKCLDTTFGFLDRYTPYQGPKDSSYLAGLSLTVCKMPLIDKAKAATDVAGKMENADCLKNALKMVIENNPQLHIVDSRSKVSFEFYTKNNPNPKISTNGGNLSKTFSLTQLLKQIQSGNVATKTDVVRMKSSIQRMEVQDNSVAQNEH